MFDPTSSLTWIYNATFWCIYLVALPPWNNHKDLNKVCFATKWVHFNLLCSGPFLEGASVWGDQKGDALAVGIVDSHWNQATAMVLMVLVPPKDKATWLQVYPVGFY